MRWWVVFAVVIAGCSLEPPALQSVAPSTVSQEVPTRVTVKGRNLAAAVRLDVDDTASPQVNAVWAVQVGATAVPPGDVARLDQETLTAVVPAGMDVGTYDLIATSPRGERLSLAGAITVAPFNAAACGDGACGDGENKCNCPADCGIGGCGDGICCAQAGETRCGCAQDCGTSTCGDGCCAASELMAGDCAQDCTCGACADGCGSGCCADTCTTSPCMLLCTCAACQLDCGNTDCTATCAGARACSIDCTATKNCDVTCNEAADCEVSCHDGEKCDPSCIGGARCVVRCGSSSCKFKTCEGGQMSCPGKIIACNRPCP